MGSSICLVLALRRFVEVSALRRFMDGFKILGRVLLVGEGEE